jgi:hypothetical protein
MQNIPKMQINEVSVEAKRHNGYGRGAAVSDYSAIDVLACLISKAR